jgi:hypothetical protein
VPQCMAALVYSLGAQVQIVGIEEKLNIALTSAGIFEQSMGARNRVGIGLSYRPARLLYIG